MIQSFYDIPYIKITDESLHEKWSPAEVNQILFRNFKKMDAALKELHELQPNDLYGFATA
jgi:hypothetical protein